MSTQLPAKNLRSGRESCALDAEVSFFFFQNYTYRTNSLSHYISIHSRLLVQISAALKLPSFVDIDSSVHEKLLHIRTTIC
jgi:hypothetical protein